MSRIFSHDVLIELVIDGNTVELSATVEFTTTPYDPGVTWGPPEYCYPPEGGEVAGARVVALEFPALKALGHVPARPAVPVDCPQWLAEVILANTADDTLLQSADFGPEDLEGDERDD